MNRIKLKFRSTKRMNQAERMLQLASSLGLLPGVGIEWSSSQPGVIELVQTSRRQRR